MEAALQLIVLIAAALVLAACATPPGPAARVASVVPVSEEISCMSDCLDDGAETCDSCAADCLRIAGGIAHVASGE